jgi:hypothetical protein
MSIPHEGEGREMKFTPGYYEFHLVREDNSKDLEPKFVDCRQDEVLSSFREETLEETIQRYHDQLKKGIAKREAGDN